MADDAQHSSDMDEEWGISNNGSEFAQSTWSYENVSATTERWVKDVFMGSGHPLGLDTPNDFPRLEGLVDLSPSTNFSLHPPTDAPLVARMSPSQDSGKDFSAFHDEMCASGSGLSEKHGHSSASPHHSGTYPPSNEPWDPVGHPRVMQYDCGFVAFADSPNSSSDQSLGEVPSGPDESPQESVIDASQDARLGSLSLGSPAVASYQQLQWEVTTGMVTYGPLRNDKPTLRDTDNRQRKGRGRHGPLDKQRAMHAHLVRKIGSCWPCRVSKVKASFILIILGTSFSLTNIFSAHWAALVKPVETIYNLCRLFLTEYAVDLALPILKCSIFPVSPLHFISVR